MPTSIPIFSKLNSHNYNSWVGEMEAYLHSQNAWMPISMPYLAPELSDKPTSEEKKKYREWQKKANAASCLIYLMVEDDQRIYLNELKDQPDKMWEALKQIHMQQCPSTRFNAYDDLFSIRKKEEENLQTLINRVETGMKRIQDLHPKDFDIAKLDNELASMALIRALPEEFSAFVSTLLLKDDLDKAKIHQAFVTEETQRRRHADESATAAIALNAALAKSVCDFCTLQGHTQANCYKYKVAQQQAKQQSKHCTKKGKKQEQANTASNDDKSKKDGAEFARNASTRLPDHSDPSLPIQPQADFDWIVDSGATCHMTPHQNWVHNYTPHHTPVRLADNSIIYSAGIGTVIFHPVVNGKKVRPLEFHRVLHVPLLQNNLLSCIYLTRNKGYNIHIDQKAMHFWLNGKELFSAKINSNNSAHLDGCTALVLESAHHSSTLPLDLNLWHRRFAHHNYADVKKMVNNKLVTGLNLNSSAKPDPICEPCLAGKMHSNPFPSSNSHASKPLELIHTDIHGPLPVAAIGGYHYWITFIDDCTSFKAAMALKKKSDAFNAFKTFKAYAENALNAKIKAL